MQARVDFASLLTRWAETQRAISGLVLIGSHVRSETNAVEYADAHSDWDFHVITSDPALFSNSRWTGDLPGIELRAYIERTAVIGGVPKVNAIFGDAEADFVVVPEIILQDLKRLAGRKEHLRQGPVRRRMQDLAVVIRPGWHFLKGARRWGGLYERSVAEVPDPRLDDEAVRRLAEGFVCDYVWTARKISRGELRTAQRTLYRELAEVNYQLLHELKQRRGERTFGWARRIERIASPAELDSITVEARAEAGSLQAELERSAATFRSLLSSLVGGAWRWPL